MVYTLKQITIRTNNTEEGIKKINEIWQDVLNGKLPLLFDSNHVLQQSISPVSKYSNYECDENGDYDLSIMGVSADFFQTIEAKVREGLYKKYDETAENGDMSSCVKRAWEKVWNDQKSGAITRVYTEDYESSVPAEYASDRKMHCYLYIAVK
jgi:predicted transcriptional regulator YdeE